MIARMGSYMLSARRNVTLAPDLRIAGLLKAEHRLRRMLADGTPSVDEIRALGLPAPVVREARRRRAVDRSGDGYGILLDGDLLEFGSYHVDIRGVGRVPVRGGCPLPDGMRCDHAFLYVDADELPRLDCYPPVPPVDA